MIKPMKMNKYTLFYILCILYILLFVAGIQAYTYPTVQPYINDFIHKLTPDQVQALQQHAINIEQNTSYEIVVVLVNTTDSQDRTMYATYIGQNSGVGKKDTDNGVVVLWTEDNERGIAIAAGRGAETYLNDAKLSDIARAARPLFESGKYYEGMDQMLTQLQQTINERDTTATGSGQTGTGTLTNNFITLIIILGVIGFIIFLIFKRINGGGSSFRGSGIGLGGFGSSGGGGLSFGGGSFGGGGGRG